MKLLYKSRKRNLQAFRTEYYHDNVLVMTRQSDFSDGILDFVRAHSIPFAFVDNDDNWIRDYLIEGVNNTYIRNKNSNYSHLWLYEDKRKSGPWDKKILYPRMASKKTRHLRPVIMKKKRIKSSNRTLEGGNLFVVGNKENKTRCFMSSDIIGAEKQLLKIKQGRRNVYGASYVTKSKKSNIMARYRKIIGVDAISLLPNTTFHLDMQMAYVGKNIFLVNSFLEMKKNFPKEYYLINGEYEKKYGESLVKSKEPIIDNICEILRENNFTVKKICANLYKKNNDMWDATGCASTFINGIALHSNANQQDYFITTNSPNKLHKKYFNHLMRKLNIIPYFINANDCTPKETIEFISHNHGAIRCQTNFLSNKRVNPVQA